MRLCFITSLLLTACGGSDDDLEPTPHCRETNTCRDLGMVDATPDRGVGEPCDANEQCADGLCFQATSEPYCSVPCEAGCPSDASGHVYDCREAVCVRRDTTYRWVLLVDTSQDTESLTPGADICGASFDCAGHTDVAAEATLEEGEGEVCGGQPDCASARNDPLTALDDGVSCADDTVPSDFVSLG